MQGKEKLIICLISLNIRSKIILHFTIVKWATYTLFEYVTFFPTWNEFTLYHISKTDKQTNKKSLFLVTVLNIVLSGLPNFTCLFLFFQKWSLINSAVRNMSVCIRFWQLQNSNIIFWTLTVFNGSSLTFASKQNVPSTWLNY